MRWKRDHKNIFHVFIKFILWIKCSSGFSKFWFGTSTDNYLNHFLFFPLLKKERLIILATTYSAETANFRCWRSSQTIFRPKTYLSREVSIKNFISKHKRSKSVSFLRVLSPGVWNISLYLGRKFLIFTLPFFDRKDPIVNFSDLFAAE